MMLNEQNTHMEFRKTLINLLDKFTYFRNAVTNHFTCSDSFCSDRYAVIHFGLRPASHTHKFFSGRIISLNAQNILNKKKRSLVPAPVTTFSLCFPKQSENVVAGAGTRLYRRVEVSFVNI